MWASASRHTPRCTEMSEMIQPPRVVYLGSVTSKSGRLNWSSEYLMKLTAFVSRSEHRPAVPDVAVVVIAFNCQVTVASAPHVRAGDRRRVVESGRDGVV